MIVTIVHAAPPAAGTELAGSLARHDDVVIDGGGDGPACRSALIAAQVALVPLTPDQADVDARCRAIRGRAAFTTTRKRTTMRKTIFIPALLAVLAIPLHAQEAPPTGSVTFNATLTSDYRYRGISQTRLQPAIQGGADWTHEPTGLYAGTWLSTIKWTKDAGGGGDVEWDLYAGKRGRLNADVSYDAGVLGYVYPANGLDRVPGSADANTAELYGQLGYGPAYVKYSTALTNLFGFTDSRHSGYLDVGANVDLGNAFTLNLHAGRQDVRGHDAASYTDYRAGVTKDAGFASVTAAFVGTNAGETAYASPANGKFLGRKALVVSVGKTF